jgi:hypothetical protein
MLEEGMTRVVCTGDCKVVGNQTVRDWVRSTSGFVALTCSRLNMQYLVKRDQPIDLTSRMACKDKSLIERRSLTTL